MSFIINSSVLITLIMMILLFQIVINTESVPLNRFTKRNQSHQRWGNSLCVAFSGGGTRSSYLTQITLSTLEEFKFTFDQIGGISGGSWGIIRYATKLPVSDEEYGFDVGIQVLIPDRFISEVKKWIPKSWDDVEANSIRIPVAAESDKFENFCLFRKDHGKTVNFSCPMFKTDKIDFNFSLQTNYENHYFNDELHSVLYKSGSAVEYTPGVPRVELVNPFSTLGEICSDKQIAIIKSFRDAGSYHNTPFWALDCEKIYAFDFGGYLKILGYTWSGDGDCSDNEMEKFRGWCEANSKCCTIIDGQSKVTSLIHHQFKFKLFDRTREVIYVPYQSSITDQENCKAIKDWPTNILLQKDKSILITFKENMRSLLMKMKDEKIFDVN